LYRNDSLDRGVNTEDAGVAGVVVGAHEILSLLVIVLKTQD
jgi:hypothetical protein